MIPPLRDYQTRAYQAASEASRRHAGILIQAPTGAGKTRVAIEIALGAVRRGVPALWLAPRIELVEQPAQRLVEYGVDATVQVIRASGTSGPSDAKIRIASIQTLVARDCAPDAGVVIFDEARHYVAQEWKKISTRYAKACRVGLDATPARSDGSPLGDLFDVIVPVASVKELTALGWLVPVVTYAPAKPQEYLAQHPVDAYLQRCAGRRAFVFCQSIAHSRRLAEEFSFRGIPAVHLDGTDADETRAYNLNRLRSGEIKVITNVQLFTEGVDVPELEAVIVARGCASESAWLQMIGRGLRPAPGKRDLILVDLRGHVHTHGLVDEDRAWHLTGIAVTRTTPGAGPVQCKGCLCWFTAGSPCPMCGATPPPPKPPKVRAADLVEVRARQSDEQKRAAWDGIVRVAAERGFKIGWAVGVYKGRFGAPPPRDWIRPLARRDESRA